ncbi:1,5-anhydro-D-fructose reductase [Novipirellula galeiformis]|uniref:1,5-anhydro-D-fructose reductase n=1 Tax=Novipirellula galeiformis TaxID=2528004 RepID=A0A5C6CP52_9BACT|nr:Gfo/Idh/MocA family oxidoreductase [Novipirellula galeiformis]TWU26168.1 1,5-anhydro-D-fructose reductase [Novipirellula galeiformis]
MSGEGSITRFGVIGTGRITRRLVADIQSTDGAEVSAIASRTSQRAQWYADQYGIAAAVEGYESLLVRDDVDAVYIALPPSMHAEWAIAAAQAGKHVLCEKPLTVATSQSLAVHAACKANSVRLLDATAWLHHERTDAFRGWLQEGRFGKLGHITAAVSFFHPFQSGEHRLDPELGGGCLLDLGWYVCSLARFVAGSLPNRMVAGRIVRQGVAQRITAMLWFDDDVTATLSCGYDTSTRKWFEVAGSDASLVCDDFTRPWHDRPARCWIHDAAGAVEQLTFEGNQERRMIARFIGDEPLDPFHQQALDTQHMIDAIQESVELAHHEPSAPPPREC